MLYTIYNYLKESLEQIPQLRRIDWYNDQLSNGVVLVSPALLIEFAGPMTAESLSKYKQAIFMTIRFHLLSKILGQKDQSFNKELLSAHFELVKQIWTKLQGLSGEYDGKQIFTSLDRIAIEHIQYLQGWFVTIQDFSTTGFDYLEETTTSRPQVKITVNG